MRYLISIKYDGSKFYGFERLKDKPSVQKEIEDALTKLNKKKVEIKGSGRTDRGVHALDQKASFDLDVDIPIERLKDAINALLNDYVYINYCEIVKDDFHARFNCIRKKYTYFINLGEYDPISQDYVYNYCRNLNVGKMKKAAKYLIGMHSYEAFTAGDRENYDSVIYHIDIKKRSDMLELSFEGKSFYRYMVRNLVGALIQVGEGKIEPIKIKEMLEKRKNITNYITAPANGLYLVDVDCDTN